MANAIITTNTEAMDATTTACVVTVDIDKYTYTFTAFPSKGGNLDRDIEGAYTVNGKINRNSPKLFFTANEIAKGYKRVAPFAAQVVEEMNALKRAAIA